MAHNPCIKVIYVGLSKSFNVIYIPKANQKKSTPKNHIVPKIKQLFFSLFMLFLGLSSLAQHSENPYNPELKMVELRIRKGKKPVQVYFLVFGNSKRSEHFPIVLKRADILRPDCCLTTADLVNRVAGAPGKINYKTLDEDRG